MAKLTDRQRKRIIAEYANGGVSQRQLATRYGVTQKTISKILNTQEVRQKVSAKKEENTLSMLEFMEKQKDRAQSIMQQILDCSDDEIKKASLRDKMGALKILSDVFVAQAKTPAENAGKDVKFEFVFKDTSMKNE